MNEWGYGKMHKFQKISTYTSQKRKKKWNLSVSYLPTLLQLPGESELACFDKFNYLPRHRRYTVMPELFNDEDNLVIMYARKELTLRE